MPFRTSDNVDHPLSLYGASKKANELMAHAYSHLFKLPTSGLRFFTVYGPWGRPDMALWLFAAAIIAGQPIKLFNHGKMRRDFTYIDDVVQAVVRLIDRPAQGDPHWSGDEPDPARSSAPWRVYNIGNNNPVELLDVVALLEKELGRKAIRELVPMQPGDVPATYRRRRRSHARGRLQTVDADRRGRRALRWLVQGLLPRRFRARAAAGRAQNGQTDARQRGKGGQTGGLAAHSLIVLR